jgi:hypothetical protein
MEDLHKFVQGNMYRIEYGTFHTETLITLCLLI